MDNVRPLRPKKQPPKPRRGRRSRRRIITSIIVAIVVLVLVFGSRILGLYVDWLWFGEVGFRSVFWTRIWWQVLVGVVAFVLFFVIVEFNVELARRLAPSYRVTATGDLLEPRSDRVRRWVGLGRPGREPPGRLHRRRLGLRAVADVPPVPQAGPVRPEGRDLRPRHQLLRLLAADVAGAAELRLRRAHRLARARRDHARRDGRHRASPRTPAGAARGRRRRGRRRGRAGLALRPRPARRRAAAAAVRHQARRPRRRPPLGHPGGDLRRRRHRAALPRLEAPLLHRRRDLRGRLHRRARPAAAHVRHHGDRLPARRGAGLEHLASGTSGGRSPSPSGSSRSSCSAASSRPSTSRSSSTRTSSPRNARTSPTTSRRRDWPTTWTRSRRRR